MTIEEDTRLKLRQVSALFHDHLRLVRSQLPLTDKEKLAEDWLKETRINIMEKLEREYEAMTRNPDPTDAPDWAIDPCQKLMIWTESFKPCLEPYKVRFANELKKLMDDCGFNAEIFSLSSTCGFAIKISFPEDHATGRCPNLHTKQVGKEDGVQSREKKQRGTVDGNGPGTAVDRGAGTTPQAKEGGSTRDKGGKDADGFEGTKKPRRPKARRKRGKKDS